MPAYSKERQDYHKERIREVLVIDPRASLEKIRQGLTMHRDPLTLDLAYISKLRKKIWKERQQPADPFALQQRVAEIEDRTRVIIGQMWSYMGSPSVEDKTKINAAKVIVDAEHKLLEAQMNAGFYDWKLGTVEHVHTHQLDPAAKTAILSALANYGIVKATTNEAPATPQLAASGGAD